jgi:hypothetical protein
MTIRRSADVPEYPESVGKAVATYFRTPYKDLPRENEQTNIQDNTQFGQDSNEAPLIYVSRALPLLYCPSDRQTRHELA